MSRTKRNTITDSPKEKSRQEEIAEEVIDKLNPENAQPEESIGQEEKYVPKSFIKGRTVHSEIELSDDRLATVHRGKGVDSKQINNVMNGKPEEYSLAAMYVLVRIDGERIPKEDFELLDLADYNKILVAISQVTGNA